MKVNQKGKFPNFKGNFLKSSQIFVLVFCVTVFSACNKLENLSPDDKDNLRGSNARVEKGQEPFEELSRVKLKNGRLIFRDWEHFVKTWQYLNTLNLQEIEKWEEGLAFSL
ncbi:hypothetical protein [Thermoflexibacter ruber]|uniref:Lipoprotein n=1 Tax=Thermoflexibacter ruber TaxID=1003 RepID=A0A1I2J2P6_9BACT|nr:hypothetical protein [Thermoflexibacter ruber]SFF48774.1 hypothetical protein SAMN04488541_10414 [Thermoflexibacter ruber]